MYFLVKIINILTYAPVIRTQVSIAIKQHYMKVEQYRLTTLAQVRHTSMATITPTTRSGGTWLPDRPVSGTRKSTREKVVRTLNMNGRLSDSASHVINKL